MEKFEIYADRNNNNLYFILKGYFLDSEVRLARQITINEVNKLQPGFNVFQDISELEYASQKAEMEFKYLFNYIKNKAVNKIYTVSLRAKNSILYNTIINKKLMFCRDSSVIKVHSIREAEEKFI